MREEIEGEIIRKEDKGEKGGKGGTKIVVSVGRKKGKHIKRKVVGEAMNKEGKEKKTVRKRVRP